MQAITLEVILRAVFGVDRRRRAASGCASAARRLLGDTASAGPAVRASCSRAASAARTRSRSCRRCRREIDALLAAEIAERRADPRRGHPARCSSRRASRTASRWTTREIRDQLMTLLLAGHETTATGLAWTFDLLAPPPRTCSRACVAELDAGDEAYLRAVVAESLRLRPVVPLAGRRLSERAARQRPRAARPAPT